MRYHVHPRSGLVVMAALCTGAALMCGLLAAPAVRAADDRLQQLSSGHRQLAQRMLTFMSAMDQKYFGRVAALNGASGQEQKNITSDYADYNIKVTRGSVVEKMGRMEAVSKKASPKNPMPGNLVWGRFYSLDAHPKSPLVGMLHATIVVQFFDSGQGFVGGWLGIMPGTRIEADLNDLKQSIDSIFTRYGISPDYYRNLICKGDPKEIKRKWRRKPACVGVSFYGRPAFHALEKNFALVSEAFDAFVGVYMGLVEKHRDSAYTQEDVQAQETMRRQWLIDQLFSDPYASKIVPFEAWSLANVPPEIKF